MEQYERYYEKFIHMKGESLLPKGDANKNMKTIRVVAAVIRQNGKSLPRSAVTVNGKMDGNFQVER